MEAPYAVRIPFKAAHDPSCLALAFSLTPTNSGQLSRFLFLFFWIPADFSYYFSRTFALPPSARHDEWAQAVKTEVAGNLGTTAWCFVRQLPAALTSESENHICVSIRGHTFWFTFSLFLCVYLYFQAYVPSCRLQPPLHKEEKSFVEMFAANRIAPRLHFCDTNYAGERIRGLPNGLFAVTSALPVRRPLLQINSVRPPLLFSDADCITWSFHQINHSVLQ